MVFLVTFCILSSGRAGEVVGSNLIGLHWWWSGQFCVLLSGEVDKVVHYGYCSAAYVQNLCADVLKVQGWFLTVGE